MKSPFHRHQWRYVKDDTSSWAGQENHIICYSAFYTCACGAPGWLDAGSRMMRWYDHIHEVKKGG